ncbi:MAG: metal ABC transporter substrate-binding protein [Xanthobacteraceae bacterium]
MPSRRHVLSLTAAAAALAAAGGLVPGRGQNKTPDQPRAVATFSILGDFVGNVGGARVQVATLVGANGDVHVYAPTPGDVKTIAAADVVFVNGLGLEGWLDRLITASATRAPVVVTSRGVAPRSGSRAHGRAVDDPHAWQSVANAKIYVGNIRDSLIASDPGGENVYRGNATAYFAALDSLDIEIKAAIESIPVARRRIVTTHSSFGYFADAYGIEFIAPEGPSTEAEPSPRDVARLIDQIRRENIAAVFIENVADPRLLQRIAMETGARIGGTLYSDALSPPDGPAATYIDLMRHNVSELTKGLRADAQLIANLALA